jgi:hypothetical protein
MTRRSLLFFTAGLLAAAGSVGGEKPQQFVVIVNKSNRFDSLSRAKLGFLFLRKVSRWPWGAEAEPIDLPPHSSVREEFVRYVLRTTDERMSAYWIDQRSTTGIGPPAQAASPAAAKSLVASRPGAIAYIPLSELDDTVKVLRVDP